ncbi:MAG: polyprenol monophosphomannose synthase [Chloroflexota bacterium]
MSISWSNQALVIVPTYNEQENIELMATQLRALPGNIHVLIVDDNSPDGTGEIADALATQDAGIHVIHRAGKLGLGTAYKAGFAYGLSRGYRYICTMDADFSHSPDSVPDLLDGASTNYDLVIGSRYVPGGKIVGCTALRQFVSYGANWLAHIILGVAARDCTAGFRCYRRTVLETINLDAIFSSGYSFLVEMTFHCQRAGFRIGEVPITFVNRRMGNSKISKTEIYKAFYTLLRLRTSALPWERAVGLYRQLSSEPTNNK